MTDHTQPTELDRRREQILGRKGQQSPNAGQPARDRVAGGARKPADRLAMLQTAAEHAQQRHQVVLPDLSAAYSKQDGVPVKIEAVLRDLSYMEVLASGLLPAHAREILSTYIADSEEATKEARAAVGLDDFEMSTADADTVPENITERVLALYKGKEIDAYAGLVQLTRVMAVMGCTGILFNGEPNEPPIELSLTRDEPGKLYIGVLTDRDVNALGAQVWENVEGDAADATPFPGGAGDVPYLVRTGDTILAAAERSDEV